MPTNNEELFSIVYSSPTTITVEQFVSDQTSPAYIYNNKPDYFLALKGEDGFTNRQRIENGLNKTAEGRKLIGASYTQLPIKQGTVLYLVYSDVTEQKLLTEGIEIVSNNDAAFKSAALVKMETDYHKEYVEINQVKGAYPSVDVWVWVRSLSNGLSGRELEGQFFDLSLFIEKISTNVSKNGGNFQITLPPLICELNKKEQKWEIKKDTITYFKNNTGLEYVADGNMIDQYGERSNILFSTILQPQDLIFIRFSTILGAKNENTIHIDKSMLAGKRWDMIGLIDSTQLSTNPSNNDVTVTVSGTDLSKLFLKDATYFFGVSNSQGILRIAGGERTKGSLLSRSFVDGGLLFMQMYAFKSIKYIFQFIINNLSNTKIVHSELFNSYGDRRNKKYIVINENEQITANGEKKSTYKPQLKKEIFPGIWGIVKLVIDENVQDRLLCDTSLSTAQGSLMGFLRTAVQEPLVQMYMDTYSDFYTITIRKPPYDYIGITTLLDGNINTEEGKPDIPPPVVTIMGEDVINEKLEMNDEQNFNIFHFFPKLAMLNDKVNYSMSILPAIFLEELGQIYGAKVFDRSHSYVPFEFKQGSYIKSKGEEQTFYDLKYVVESSQYLPFSRKGTIIVNGDVRIKVGNIIRYQPTGEVFFVTSCQQNFSINGNQIDRTSVITVERGLVEALVYGINYLDENGNPHEISYFNIVNTELNLQYKEQIVETIKRIPIENNNSNSNTVNNSHYEGFGEYMQHQQGTGGSHIIAKGYLNNTPKDKFDKRILKNMASNVEGDFVGELNPVNFINYWIKRYNKNYVIANSKPSSYDNLYQTVCGEEGVPIEIIKTFGQIESANKALTDVTTTHRGIMQISNEIADSYGLSNIDVKDSITMACRLYKQYNKDNPFSFLLTQVNNSQQYREETVTTKTKVLDSEVVFNNFRVNRVVLNYFLKRLQFAPENRTVKSRVSLRAATVTGKRKKK